MIISSKTYRYSLLALLLFTFGCSNIKYLNEGESLVTKNKIIISTKKGDLKKRQFNSGLKGLLKQKPNKKMIGLFKLNLYLYNKGSKGKINRFNYWLKEKAGEAPVLLDSVKTVQSAKLMKRYLFNKGFFNTTVAWSTNNKKRAKISYLIESGPRYKIDSLIFPQGGSHLSRTIRLYPHNSLIKRGDYYDIDMLKKERERITNEIRNVGYFDFNNQYVNFEVDSNGRKKQVDIRFGLVEPGNKKLHHQYFIGNVYIYPDYRTETFTAKSGKDTLLLDNYYFITNDLQFQHSVLINSIFLEKGRRYSNTIHENTLHRLSNMSVFKFVNLKFVVDAIDSLLLHVHIYLTPGKKHELSVEGELSTNTSTSSSYPLGMALNFSFKTKDHELRFGVVLKKGIIMSRFE